MHAIFGKHFWLLETRAFTYSYVIATSRSAGFFVSTNGEVFRVLELVMMTATTGTNNTRKMFRSEARKSKIPKFREATNRRSFVLITTAFGKLIHQSILTFER